jgi:paraquat-inducible protein A
MISIVENSADSDERMSNLSLPVIACRECDLLQREITLSPGGSARCSRCGALLYRDIGNSIDQTVAFLLAAAVLYLIANIYPIVGLEVQGIRNTTTLSGAVHALLNQGFPSVAFLVFVTTILAPAVEIAAMLYLLLPIRLGRIPVGFAVILLAVQVVKRWNMVEVFMLALLVSVVKLSSFASVVPDLALWSFGGLTLLMAAAAASFDSHEIRACAEKAIGTEMTL